MNLTPWYNEMIKESLFVGTVQWGDEESFPMVVWFGEGEVRLLIGPLIDSPVEVTAPTFVEALNLITQELRSLLIKHPQRFLEHIALDEVVKTFEIWLRDEQELLSKVDEITLVPRLQAFEDDTYNVKLLWFIFPMF